jgi:hypothetical protein
VPDATYRRTSAELIRQLDTLPGLTVDAQVDSSFTQGRGNVNADVTVPVAATTAQMDVIVETIERTVWLSHLDPLGPIGINIRRQGSSVRARPGGVYHDSSELRAKYGPRPDGLPD